MVNLYQNAFKPMFVDDIERHVTNAIRHKEDGNLAFAEGSLRKAKRFYLRKLELSAALDPFQRGLNMERVEEFWASYLRMNGIIT